jgi:Enoyl-(Acyl carrier protein) reductase
MHSLTEAPAIELAPLRVNAVAPGVTRGPVRSGLDEGDHEAMYDELGKTFLTGGVGGVEDAADAFLSRRNQPQTTGAVITVDGGGVLVWAPGAPRAARGRRPLAPRAAPRAPGLLARVRCRVLGGWSRRRGTRAPVPRQ